MFALFGLQALKGIIETTFRLGDPRPPSTS